ncbi:MAG: UDP-N-acetylglucosamine pyrophosphorylase [Desulfomonilia bacterium]
MKQAMSERVNVLISRGVRILNPASVEIDEKVNLENISSEGVVMYPGCRIEGNKTLIMKGAKLGHEAPVTVKDCQIGPDVELKGGFFTTSVFLHKSNLASGAHVRDACILEEEANGAHTVGLKQTILLPFVTLGSLINFCDCLMAGGTSRKNHSEVGSSYIHFNYTPNQDKATASLIGDVPRGVMLNQRPIFLGGQGGLVGPALIGFGTVIAAGVVFRGDVPEGGKIIQGLEPTLSSQDFHSGLYWEIRRKVRNNLIYIANVIALKAWYHHVRSMFFGPDFFEQALFTGALEKLDMAIDERISRLKALAQKMPTSVDQYRTLMKDKAREELITLKEELFRTKEELEAFFETQKDQAGNDKMREVFLSMLSKEIHGAASEYIPAIQGLSPETRTRGVEWMQGIVDGVCAGAFKILSHY